MMRIKKLTVTFLLVLFAVALAAETLPGHAASSLVQQKAGGVYGAPDSTISVPFTNNVASGNVVVVGVVAPAETVTGVSDSLLSSYNLAVATSSIYNNVVSIYYATLTASGADTVTVTLGWRSTHQAWVFIYEVAGVTATSVGTASGSGRGNPVSNPVQMTTSTSVSFQSGAFLLGVAWIGLEVDGGFPVAAGSGFTLSDQPSFQYTGWAQAEYSTGGVSSPTNFPATFGPLGQGGDTYWAKAGITLNPTASPPTPTPRPVGGLVMPTNKLEILKPYIALAGLVTVVSAVEVARRRQKT